MPQLRLTAQWLATRSKARGIPLTYIGVDGVRARKPGVIQHNDYSVGTGDGDHWDCGPGYPVDVVIAMARDIAAGKPATARPAIPKPAIPKPVMPKPGTPKPKQEDDMFNDDDRRLLREVKARLDDDGPIGRRTKDCRDRILGMLQQRWFTLDSSGRPVGCPPSDPGATPCSALDTLDGTALLDRIAGLATEVQGLLARSAPAVVPAPAVAPTVVPAAAQIAAGVPSDQVQEVIDALVARLGVPVGAGVP